MAKVSFSYEKQLILGNVTAIKLPNEHFHKPIKSFEVCIEIYGFTQRNPHIDKDLLLSDGQRYSAILKKKRYLLSEENRKTRAFHNNLESNSDKKDNRDYKRDSSEVYYYEEEENNEKTETESDDVDDEFDYEDTEENELEEEAFGEHLDKVIELGERQQGKCI